MSPATARAGSGAPPLHERAWPWRERLRANPVTAGLWRVGVALAGLLVVVVGLLLVPLPGPGWAIVFGGVFVWALEFAWAGRLLHAGRRWLGRWAAWVAGRPLWVRAGLSLLCGLVVLAALWLALWALGVPDAVPPPWRERITEWGHLSGAGALARGAD